jgi:hypothetical protein
VAALRPDRLIAWLLLAACAGAGAQDRVDLPIQLKASSLDFDSQKGVVEYGTVLITQGAISISADRAVTTGVDFDDSKWQFSGTVMLFVMHSKETCDFLVGFQFKQKTGHQMKNWSKQ